MHTTRSLLASLVFIGLSAACHSTGAATGTDSHAPRTVAEHSIRLLEEGNARFVENRAHQPHTSSGWRRTVAKGQHPFAVIVGCADSRVPVEVVFDRGLGDLFVCRNAGNVGASDVLASIDYATTHLHVPLVVVMGHSRCGAVSAALGPKEARTGEGADLQALLGMIDPALAAYDVHGTDPDAVAAGVEANIRWTVARLKEDAANGTLPGAGDVTFVGAVYDLESGRVRLLDSD